MVRDELIEGATTFLQDPSVASAPIEQRTAFLRSKNLTQDEIDAALSRVGQSTGTSLPPTSSAPPQQYRQQYGSYQQPPPYWNMPPPEPPHRDWRDWFITATVIGGLSYGLYWTANRYILPLLTPPTTPQLQTDKESIDAQFDKTFALLDQLTTDTAALKDSEEARTKRLDATLAEVESILGKMRDANEQRDVEAKRMGREMEGLREQIPRAIEKERESTDGKLKDVVTEMRSLKVLVGNRMQGQGQARASVGSLQAPSPVGGINGAVPAPETNGGDVPPSTIGTPTTEDGEKAALPDRSSGTSSPYGRLLSGKAQIPSWQLAAKKRSEAAATNSAKEGSGASTPAAQDVAESGTVAEASPVS